MRSAQQDWFVPDAKLPQFRYHPDPLATGSIGSSETRCVCCGQARGYIYTGPVYATEEYDGSICPWCIADGSAHDKLDASFHDESGIGGYGDWDEVPESVIEEVAYRTPGFTAWQQEQWWTHCNDAGRLLGVVGAEELRVAGPKAIAAVKASVGIKGDDWEEFFEALSKEGSPSAYLFRCSKCGQYGGYADSD